MAPKKQPIQYISVTQAMEIAKECGIDYSRPTIIRYVKEHKLGFVRKIGCQWSIDKFKFMRWLHGANKKTK